MKIFFFLSILWLGVFMNSTHASPAVKVLTLNVGGLNPFGKLTSPQDDRRLRSLCSELGKQDYDVIFLQEVWTQGYRKLFKGCGFPFSLTKEKISGLELKWRQGLLTKRNLKIIAQTFATLFPRNYGFDTGLMILSKFPLKEGKILRFFKNGSEESAFKDGEFPVNKGALGASLIHPEIGELFLVNTHLVSNYHHDNYLAQREEQLASILSWIEENKKERPVILGGDFNVSPPKKNEGRRHLNTQYFWSAFRNSYLRGYQQADLPFETMSTYINSNGDDEGVLDHLFSTGLRPILGGLAFTEKIPCGKELCRPSDHFGLHTTFTFK